jgi:hypothetical protein
MGEIFDRPVMFNVSEIFELLNKLTKIEVIFKTTHSTRISV